MPTDAQLRRRIARAIQELQDHTSESIPWGRMLIHLRDAMEEYLGPCLGLRIEDHWRRLSNHELELLCDGVEERAAMVATE